MFLSSKFFPNFFPNKKSSDSNEDKKHKNNEEKLTQK